MINFSATESDLFGLRFGRYEGPMPDAAALVKEVEQNAYNFVRLKLTAPGDDLFIWLNSLGIPYHLLDIHRHYWLDYEQTPLVPGPEAEVVHLVRHEGQLTDTIRQLVYNTFDEHPMGFFRHPVIDRHFPVELQKQNVADYIARYHTQTTNPGKQSWLITINGEEAGCGSTELKGDEAYTTYIGLLPRYRKRHFYAGVIYRMQYQIMLNGARYCTGSARLHNLSSQSVFERQGERYTRHDYVVMLMPGVG